MSPSGRSKNPSADTDMFTTILPIRSPPIDHRVSRRPSQRPGSCAHHGGENGVHPRAADDQEDA